MSNKYIPFDLLDQLELWINQNFAVPSSVDIRKELNKLKIILEYMKSNSITAPTELKEKYEKLKIVSDFLYGDKLALEEFAERLQLLSKKIKSLIKSGKKGTKAPPKKLRVTFPDGQIVCEKKAVDTYIKTIQYLGVQQVAEIQDVIILGHPAVSMQQNINAGFIKEVNGYYFEVKTSTMHKAKLLNEYANKLGVKLVIDIIEPFGD